MLMTDSTIPRKPTPEEVVLLAQWVCAQRNEPVPTDQSEIDDLIAGASIAVFDGYITDGPGYSGRIMVVVWSGAPEFFNCFTLDAWYRNIKVSKLEEVRQ
jgi:hypothetical protein